ncbi:F-box only protein [Ooceraea biroi]|uniref:F-box only protein n=1 Tax=Ooceraea biroi TaxID=2015173 RepID=A0A026WIT6_OOCBI|nr:F-box only protein [Ooceraea biroi]
MEVLRVPNRVVDISEPILAEDSTFSELALSLKAILEQLDEKATHHDYFVALLLVLLAESGFRVQQNKRLVHIPSSWKQRETGVYEIDLVLDDLDHIQSKLIAIPYGDVLIFNAFAYIEPKVVYSMAVHSFKYVNPYTHNVYMRYMNLKEISHNFKDTMVTPLRTDILLTSGRTGPSFQCLPRELHNKIANMRRLLECQN